MSTWVPGLLLLLLIGIFSEGVIRSLPITVVDQDNGYFSRQLLLSLSSVRGVKLSYNEADLDSAWSRIRQLESYAVVYIPAGTERHLARGEAATIFNFYNASYLTPGQSTARDIQAALQAVGAQFQLHEQAQALGPREGSGAPVRVQSSILFNPERSYEVFLGGLVFPAAVHLLLTIAVASALAREIRDKRVGRWVVVCGGRPLAAISGKVLPYLAIFGFYGLLGMVWYVGLRGPGVAGNLGVLLLGYCLMLLAYTVIALLVVSGLRNMAKALSALGLFAGTSLAFSGATFPVQGGPVFTQVWNTLLPFTAYVHLQAQQVFIGGNGWPVWRPILALLVFILLAGSVGGLLFRKVLREPQTWGRR
ncbi:ABC transporter permease [Pseudomonas tolaasii]|uniref:ABC transporter permease n=1 Tax=Pseudomonas tolaasii TaxID=29442 RepID=UPI0012FD7996|nr:ABC transporter permease [Pseudomonas tolaasii]